ncbi:MAG: ABC transporter substrate-binding protein [Rhodospirillales bacterium]
MTKAQLLGGALSAALLAWSGVAVAEDSITVVSWGGTFQEAQRKAFYDPAAKALGITIKEDTTNGIQDVRAQVQSGNPTWDVTELGSNSCVQLKEEGMIEPLDYNIINTDGIPDTLVDTHWVGIIFYSTVLGYSTEAYKDGPKNWVDFFDTEKFPGARSMYRKPYNNLEIALMADGVPRDEVYPIDVDRAFKKLAEIKDDVAVWWKSGAQSAQLVKDGEVEMISVWNGRIGNAMKDGAKADIAWDGAVLDFDCLVVPKGAPNKELAMKAINEFLKPENQAALPQYINYGPVNLKAFDTGIIPKELADNLPSSPSKVANSLIFSPSWWNGRYDELQERFDLFIAE